MIETTVIIATIGRETLPYTIKSAVREGFKVIVVGDGIDIPQNVQDKFPVGVTFTRTGRNYGHYGAIAHNLAALLATTDFVTELDDDDEIIENKGKIIREKINSNPEIDIWIPGLLLSNGNKLCVTHKNLEFGNVALPTVRTTVFATSPKRYLDKEEWADVNHGIDFYYISQAVKRGFKIDWMGEEIVAVRPRLKGSRGFSKLTSEKNTKRSRGLLL